MYFKNYYIKVTIGVVIINYYIYSNYHFLNAIK